LDIKQELKYFCYLGLLKEWYFRWINIPGNVDMMFAIESVSGVFANSRFTVFRVYEAYTDCGSLCLEFRRVVSIWNHKFKLFQNIQKHKTYPFQSNNIKIKHSYVKTVT
jgi:hypothetical protein